MPHFYFHLYNRVVVALDEQGRELADLAAARAAAVGDIRSILAEDAKSGVIDLMGRIEVNDEAGRRLTTVLFADAVEIIDARDPG